MQSHLNEDLDYQKFEDEISVETLLSDLSDDEANDKPPKRRGGLARQKQLGKKFALRDTILERLGEGKNDAYINMLQHHEEMVRAEAFRLLEQDGCGVQKAVETKDKTNKKDASATDSKVGKTIEDYNDSESRLRLLKRILFFEINVVFPSFVSMLLYCSAHMAFYEVIYTLTGEISEVLGILHQSVFVGSIILSFVLFRANGGLWDWCSTSTHEIAKFELHNRLQLEYWDAKLHHWFRKRYPLKQFFSCVAFYLCYVAVEEMKISLFRPSTSDRMWILDKLPSKPYGVETTMTLWLNDVLTEECEENISEVEMEECLLFNKLTKDDDDVLEKLLSVNSYEKFFGDEKARPVPILFTVGINTCFGLVSFFILYYKLGSRVYD